MLPNPSKPWWDKSHGSVGLPSPGYCTTFKGIPKVLLKVAQKNMFPQAWAQVRFLSSTSHTGPVTSRLEVTTIQGNRIPGCPSKRKGGCYLRLIIFSNSQHLNQKKKNTPATEPDVLHHSGQHLDESQREGPIRIECALVYDLKAIRRHSNIHLSHVKGRGAYTGPNIRDGKMVPAMHTRSVLHKTGAKHLMVA